MWIPNHEEPSDPNIRLAVITAAKASNPKGVLREMYDRLVAIFKAEEETHLPRVIEVSTGGHDGGGYTITAVDAYHAAEEGFLSEQKQDQSFGYGMTNATLQFYWRELDMAALYDYLGDDALVAPEQLLK